MLSVFYEKLVIIGGMFITTMVFGLMPIRLVQVLNRRQAQDQADGDDSDDNDNVVLLNPGQPLLGAAGSAPRHQDFIKTVISFASCFSGGVFIAALLLDLFPDVHEAVDRVLDELEKQYHTTIDYPVSEFIIVLGFFTVLILEQIVLDCKESWRPAAAAVAAPAPSQYGSTWPESTVAPQQHQHQHHDEVGLMGMQNSALRSVMLVMALSLHSLFEGLAIGLQQQVGQLMSIFIAVVVHKAVMAFSLGLNVAQSGFKLSKAFVSVLLFSISSPIGIGVGLALLDLQQNLVTDCVNGLLQGMAGGTFLYITFFEVLPHEFHSSRHRMPKLLFLLFGYSCICGLLFLTH